MRRAGESSRSLLALLPFGGFFENLCFIVVACRPKSFHLERIQDLILNTESNEGTKVQNPRYKDVTLKAYTSASSV